MTDTQASDLEPRPPAPGIAELLAGKSMPVDHRTEQTPEERPAFTAEIPAVSSSSSAPKSIEPDLPPLPSPGTLRDVVSSAMDEPPVAMPAPNVVPKPKKSPFSLPFPQPEVGKSAAPAKATPPPIENNPEAPRPEKKKVDAPETTGEIKPVGTAAESQPDSSTPPPVPPSPFKSGPSEAPPSIPEYQESLPGFEDMEKESGDAQLVEALLPIVETSLEKALYAPKTGLHMYLEPMLRATVRRAIAEQMQTMHHFGQISLFDRIAWRLKALFTSQTYDDIVFERTHRYRVEEVFLLRHESNTLISYASHDPSRHSTPRKIKYDLGRMIEELKDHDGSLRKSFELPNRNTAVVRFGENCFLLACVKGPINALVRADLDYVLAQVEQRFGERLRDQNQQFIHVLQPLLEGCLLIQSPPAPR